MPDLGDFHAFNSTQGSSGGGGGGGGGGCFGWVIAAIIFLWLLGKFGG